MVSLPPVTNIEMNVTVKLQTENTAMPSAPVAPRTILLSRIALTNNRIVLTTEAIPPVQSSPRYRRSVFWSLINFSVRFLKNSR